MPGVGEVLTPGKTAGMVVVLEPAGLVAVGVVVLLAGACSRDKGIRQTDATLNNSVVYDSTPGQ